MFADQVNPAGRADYQARMDAVVALELIADGVDV
jgi:hypothetical protein